MIKRLASIIIVIAILLSVISCGKNPSGDGRENSDGKSPNESAGQNTEQGVGENIDDELYAGDFEEICRDVEIICEQGTENAYTLENGILTFTTLSEDSVYSISGKLSGNIIVDVGENCELEIELKGISISSNSDSPIIAKSAKELKICAKSGYESYIYDKREKADETDEGAHSGAIYAECDLTLKGKGKLTLVSENNNGIHTKDDLTVKNLTLFVKCRDNALKGNDSVTLESGKTTLISAEGDAIKTTNSNVSEKGNQRGTVSILGGSHELYSARDGIDSAYDVTVEGESTELKIYTDKYSNYSETVADVSENEKYVRYTSDQYKYSLKYINSSGECVWVNAEYHSTVSDGRSRNYYYSYEAPVGYDKLQLYIYSADMEQTSDTEYLACTEELSVNTAFDTIALMNRGYSLSYSWTNYSTTVSDGFGGGFGGMNEGNSDKADYSSKGIKSSNQISVNNGSVYIKSYDDAIHANNDEALENSSQSLGSLTVNGGIITVYSNDDGLHADGILTVNGGSISILNSYEGLEGERVIINSGDVSVISSDDGINATASDGTAISISGGIVYVYSNGDGIDSNSRESYKGISFLGGDTVIISTSSGNSAIDTERGYEYVGGRVVAIMPSGGMSSESKQCQEFSSSATSKSLSLKEGDIIEIDCGVTTCLVRIPKSMNALIIYLGSNSADITASGEGELDSNGVYFS